MAITCGTSESLPHDFTEAPVDELDILIENSLISTASGLVSAFETAVNSPSEERFIDKSPVVVVITSFLHPVRKIAKREKTKRIFFISIIFYFNRVIYYK